MPRAEKDFAMLTLRPLLLASLFALGAPYASAATYHAFSNATPADVTHLMGDAPVSSGHASAASADFALLVDTTTPGAQGQITLTGAYWSSQLEGTVIGDPRTVDYQLSAPLRYALSTDSAHWDEASRTLSVSGQLNLLAGPQGSYLTSDDDGLLPREPGATRFTGRFQFFHGQPQCDAEGNHCQSQDFPVVSFDIFQNLSEELWNTENGLPTSSVHFSGGYCGGALTDCSAPLEAPIPASAWLLGSALVGLGAARRKP